MQQPAEIKANKENEALSTNLSIKGPDKIARWQGKHAFQSVVRRPCEILPETDPLYVQPKTILDDYLKVLHDKKIKLIDKLNWQVLIVKNSPRVQNAVSISNGKILFFENFIRRYSTDLEIATVIGHEVAHIVAKPFRIPFKQRIRDRYFVQLRDHRFYQLRKAEYEADYVGMILMAYAGYDPRAAPLLYAKMGKQSGRYDTSEFCQTHPCGKNRELRLCQSMEEAVDIYNKCPNKKFHFELS